MSRDAGTCLGLVKWQFTVELSGEIESRFSLSKGSIGGSENVSLGFKMRNKPLLPRPFPSLALRALQLFLQLSFPFPRLLHASSTHFW